MWENPEVDSSGVRPAPARHTNAADDASNADSKAAPESLPPPRRVDLNEERRVPLTLDQAVNATLLAHPIILAGVESINQVHAVEHNAALPPNPALLADMQMLPLTRPFVVNDEGGPPQTDFQVSYAIDWFLFGKRAAAMASAAAGSRISEAAFADLVRQVVRDTSVAYYDAIEAKLNLEIEKRILTEFQETEHSLRKHAKDKKRLASNLSRVENETFKQERVIRNAEAAVVTSLANLRARVGIPNRGPGIDVVSMRWDVASEAIPSVDEALAIAEQNRPDISALRLQLHKANLDVTVQRTTAYPSVAPMLGYTRQFQEKVIGSADASSWDITLNMGIPLFNRNQYGIASAKSSVNQANLNLDAGLIRLRAEIVKAVQDVQLNEEHVKALTKRRLKAAEDLRETIQQAFTREGGDLLDVLDAIRNYHEIANLWLTSRTAYLRAVVSFNATVGKQQVKLLANPGPPPADPLRP